MNNQALNSPQGLVHHQRSPHPQHTNALLTKTMRPARSECTKWVCKNLWNFTLQQIDEIRTFVQNKLVNYEMRTTKNRTVALKFTALVISYLLLLVLSVLLPANKVVWVDCLAVINCSGNMPPTTLRAIIVAPLLTYLCKNISPLMSDCLFSTENKIVIKYCI